MPWAIEVPPREGGTELAAAHIRSSLHSAHVDLLPLNLADLAALSSKAEPWAVASSVQTLNGAHMTPVCSMAQPGTGC